MNFHKRVCKAACVLLLAMFLLATGLFAQNASPIKQNGEFEKSLLELLKRTPGHAGYFLQTHKPKLAALLKKNDFIEKMDSTVSFTINSGYQKELKTFKYDENGYYSNITRILYKNGVPYFGEKYDFDFRNDGQLNFFENMKLINGAWVNDSRGTYSYDPAGNLITETSEEWDTTANEWVYDYKYEYVYDSNNNLVLETNYEWAGGNWEKYDKFEYVYDSKNNMISKIKLLWQNGAWENEYKYEYTYDANNNQTELVYYYWISGAWEKASKRVSTYDANNNKISEIYYTWDALRLTWKNYYLSLYGYNSNNQTTFSNRKQWDEATSAWVDKYRNVYDYDSNYRLIHILSENYDSGNWIKNYEETYEYDQSGNLKILTHNETEKDRYLFRYNTMGMCNGVKHEKWEGDHWENSDDQLFLPWIIFSEYSSCSIGNLREIHYYASSSYGYELSVYYQGVTSVDENDTPPVKFALEQNYPNPFNPSTVINYQIPETEFVSLKVFDVLGNEVATLVNQQQAGGRYSVTFDASSVSRPVSSGIYFYRLQAGNNIRVRKMMLLK